MTSPTIPVTTAKLTEWFRDEVEAPLAHLVGGVARLKVITLLACVLALDSADKATVGAVAAELETALHISNIQVAWLVTASTAVGAIITLPFGILADRIHRSRLLVGMIVAWSLAMAVSGASTSYVMLLLSRLCLGGIVAAASPTVMSLIGDFFRPGERGRILGYTLAGELLGVAFGFLVSGNVAGLVSWRAAFWVLAVLGLVLAAVIWRYLPEPARGGQGVVPVGAMRMPDGKASEPDRQDDPEYAYDASGADIEQEVESREISPDRDRVLNTDPARMTLWQAVKYICSIRTYRSLVLASALGYFYFTGVRTFALVFMRARFDLGQAAASTLSVVIGCGAIVGVLLAGRLGDALIGRGRLNGRVLAAGGAFLIAAAAFIPGFLVPSLWISAVFLFIAAAGVGGANPALDAARLDTMHSGLWGRAEGVRATLRFSLEAIAPPLFGYVAAWFSPVHHAANPAAGAPAHGGLGQAFLVMLIPLVAAGLILCLKASRTYLHDVATTVASEQATRHATPDHAKR